MSQVAIHVEGLGKRYRIGEREYYRTLRDALTHTFRAPWRRFRPRAPESSNHQPQHIWALKDISFEVREGEVVGLIGRNGAGKTTLLKILARVTRPTEGYADVRGRMGSLLEVGTGFHHELTGRENTFLSGAILGMSKNEITRKFDEIVAFAGVEKFIDTPLKHYSSGMQMRLAFAIAAHLDPEILLVDEVLAVGDLEFQKKCLGKMSEVARGGRTILFVSHNMGAVNALCPRCILMDSGHILADGVTPAVTTSYHMQLLSGAGIDSDLRNARRTGSGKAIFSSMTIEALDASGGTLPIAHSGCDLGIELEVEGLYDIPGSNVAVIIYDSGGFRLIDINTSRQAIFLQLKKGETARVRFHIRELLLKPGVYVVGLWLGRDCIEEIDNVECAATFEVAPNPQVTKQPVEFPGPYVCRFETKISCF